MRGRIPLLTAIVFLMPGMLVASLPAMAQAPQKVFRVGHLAAPGKTPDGGPPRALVDALRGLGYVEGRNIAYEARFAEGKLERLPQLAAELVQLKMDVIVAQGGASTEAARRATTTIPIVMAPAAGDAVAVGWISTLARPGGNITGLSDESVQLSAKRMELLKEAVPQAALIAIVWNDNDHGMTLRYREIEKAARTLRVEVLPLGVRNVEDFTGAFEAMTRRKPDAMFIVTDEFAATHRIPAMYETSTIVREGGLMSYGPSFEDGFREAAGYIDRILKGAKPIDLPAVQPRRYYLAVNLKAAAALGLTMPPSLLLRSDELIQ